MKISFHTTRAGPRLAITAGAILLGLAAQAAHFEDVTTPSGIGQSSGVCYGPAWGDYNNDGFPDLYITAGLGSEAQNFLFRNAGNGTFVRVGAEAGPVATALNRTAGCAWVDFNNDGFRDLFLLNGYWFAPGLNDLFWNRGDGTFSRRLAGELTSRNLIRTWQACADFDGDGWVDVAISGEGTSTSSLVTQLYRATGHETFTRTELGMALNEPNACVWADYDNDGDPDLFVTDTGKSPAWRNEGQGRFTALDLSPFTELGSAHFAWGDYDNDGDLDLALSHYTNGFADNQVFRNENGTAFVHAVTLINAPGFPTWADYDNDGYLDLLVVHGQDFPRKAALYHNNGDGTFTRASDVFTEEPDRWTGPAWGDYDNDGFMDLLMLRNVGSNRLYRNLKNDNHWLKFVLTGTLSNRDAIGAKVRVLATIGSQAVWQMREIGAGGSLQEYDSRPNFGLGDATVAERVIIEWPSGNVTELTDKAANQTLSIRETASITPTRPSASLNGSVTLSTRGSGTVQWRFEGVDLPGETNRNLVLTNLTAEQAGRYSVVLDTGTTVVTNFTYLTVDPTFTKITEGSPVTDLGCSWVPAWGDYDGDDHPDLLVPRYLSGINALHHNQGDGTFHAVPNPPFPQTSGAWVSGAFADLDNNGAADLIVAGWNQPMHLSFNERDGTFTTSTLSGIGMFWSLSMVDYDRDGYLDIFLPGQGSSSTLFRGLGERSFTRMTAQAVGPLLTSSQFGNAAWADYDDDGWPEVYTAHLHQNRNDLFKNDGTGKFTRVDNLVTRTAEPGIVGAWADYDNDGDLDLCVACFGGQSTSVYRNLGNGEFERANLGLTLGTGNSASWADYDNDGWLDLYMTYPRALYRGNGDGTFTRVFVGSPVNETPLGGGDSYIGMWFDYNNDGFLDLYVVNGNETGTVNTVNFLYRNTGNDNGWLKVKLIGTTSNRDGIGAKVRMLPAGRGQPWQRRDISGGDPFNGNQLYAHFGLGSATTIGTLCIEWPSGIVQELQNIPAKQMITVIEPHLQGSFDGAGAFRIAVTCDTHRSYGLEVSTDLVEWTNVANFTEGSGVYTEDSPHTQRRFYRLR